MQIIFIGSIFIAHIFIGKFLSNKSSIFTHGIFMSLVHQNEVLKWSLLSANTPPHH